MKRKNALTFMTILTVIIFTAGSLFAQNGSTNQNQDQNQNQVQKQVQSQIKLQDKNQFQNKIHGNHFVDLNNDGYNDNAPDSDGDGIPNGQDPDYTKPLNGKGSKFMGDRTGLGKGYKFGSGVCDGTGPHGKRGGKR